ncbi:MAG: hypothetical protein Q8N23_06460 [Archangium sp.]|nr:hypothetical protein [Archangium sp.]MDP3570691.1 hypothetical protein [Archangium sp.]
MNGVWTLSIFAVMVNGAPAWPACATFLAQQLATASVDAGARPDAGQPLLPEFIQPLTLSVSDTAFVLAITPAQLPPSKTRLLFDSGPQLTATRQKALRAVTDALAKAAKPESVLISKASEFEILQIPTTAPMASVLVALDALRADSDVKHFEVAWDPAENKPLTRTVHLSRGVWQVSMASVPIEFEREPFSNAAWVRLCVPGSPPHELAVPDAGMASAADTHAYAFHAASKKAQPLLGCAPQEGWQAASLRFEYLELQPAEELLANFGTLGESITPIGSVPRGFGLDVEKLAADAFQAVADVAVVRAQQAALDAAKDIIVKRVCVEWAGEMRRVLRDRYSFGSDTFGRSCAVLENVSAAGLATLGQTLKNALQADAVELASELVSQHLGRCIGAADSSCRGLQPIPGARFLGPALGTLAGVVAAAVFESDAALPRAQAFVVQVARSQREQPNTPLKLAMSVMAYCHQAGSCDSHTIRSLLENPKDVILQEGALTAKQKEQLGDLVSLVSHGLTIMSPKKGDDPHKHVLNALRFGKGAIRLLAVAEECHSSHDCQATVHQVEDAFDMLFAAVEGEPVRLVTMAGALLARALGLQESPAAVKILSALATYADAYVAGGSTNSSPEQQRQRRAEAVAALADIAKQRDLREGDLSLAVGAWVGPRASYANDAQGYFQLSLPLGLIAQYHAGRTWGIWAGAFAVDIGDYGRVTMNGTPSLNPSPISALSFGGSLGMWFGSDFMAAVDGRYQPWANGGGAPSPAFSVGLSLGYALPLIWLR